MSLINTRTSREINKPGFPGEKMKADLAWIWATYNKPNEAEVQVQFWVNNPDTSEGQPEYVLATSPGPYNLGICNTDWNSATTKQEIHDFAISKLGTYFEVSSKKPQ
jgi:hypothetical protein